jgi:hypothetical protein
MSDVSFQGTDPPQVRTIGVTHVLGPFCHPCARLIPGWEALGGEFTSAPAAVSWGSGRLDVFGVGLDGQLYHRAWDNAWNDWEPLGGLLTSPPVAVSWGPNRVDIFGLGGDSQMYHKVWNGRWAEWAPIGGRFDSPPAAVSRGPNRLDVFALGPDNQLNYNRYDGDWHGWEGLGGTMISLPTVTSWDPNRLDVFGVGTDDHLYHRAFEGAWGNWESLGGASVSSPSVVTRGPGRVDAFALGTDHQMFHQAWDGGWAGWKPLGGVFNLPQANVAPVDFALHAFNIVHKRSNAPAGKSDTVKVSASLRVDDQSYPTLFRDLGDLNDTGWYGLNLTFPSVTVRRDSHIALSFLILNSGHGDQTKVKDDMKKATDALVVAAAASIPATGFWGLLATGATALAKLVLDSIVGLFTANCDGPLAADVYQLTGAQVMDNDWASARGYPGTDSEHGCGGNSYYHVGSIPALQGIRG